MPSPVIPRSKSAPDINSPHSPSNPFPSSASVRSIRSTGSPITSWPSKLINSIIIRGRNTKKKDSNLTEARLEEFNRRNALIEARYNSSSPYYKGLTDFSLVIGRETYAAAPSFVSSSSKSSFVSRVQEWGSSCFTSRKQDKEPVVVTKITSKKTRNEYDQSERKKVTFGDKSSDCGISSNTEKPLRERECERASPPPEMVPVTPPAAAPPESLPYRLPEITPPPQKLFSGRPPPENKETSERKYVWADTYRPSRLDDFLCNRKTALWLQTIASNLRDRVDECGHFIFEGNPGVGKRTMIWALLKEAFGKDRVQAREESKIFYLKGESVGSILVNLKVSPQHVEVNLSELKGYEKHVIVELIKEKSQLLSDTQMSYKAIILHDADKLSIDALSYIKWMLEKFKGSNKVFFCGNDAKKLQCIIPLCTYVQLLEPSVTEILEVLGYIAKQEGIELSPQLAYKIAINSKNNLRQAIRSFEATWHFNGCSATLTEDQDIKTGWEDKIANIARNVLEEQSPKQLYNIRGELQNLIEHNVPPEFIFQTLKEELKKILAEEFQPQFHHLYDEYQKNHAVKKYLLAANQQEELGKRQNDQRKNVQQFMRIEEFIARFMSWYKGLVIKNKEV